MSDATRRAEELFEGQRAFRLGELLTETSHSGTRRLSQTAAVDLPGAIGMLQSVDDDIPPAMEKVLAQDCYRRLIDAFLEAMRARKRIFFTGCGATGQLSILLEAAWRRFWRTSGHADTEMKDGVFSVMAGGDFALIKSVEGYEDFPDFGRRREAWIGVMKSMKN